jgi:hypothetical protein
MTLDCSARRCKEIAPMQRIARAVTVLALVFAYASTASADPAPAPASASAPAPAPAPASAPLGLAVVALAGATDAAWPLAQSVYSDPSLRPAGIDDAHARVLCGQPVAPTDAADVRDLAETIEAIHGDDVPSRTLLDAVARRFSVRGLVVVRTDADHPIARVFLTETHAFDAATYAPDAPDGTSSGPSSVVGWTAATRSLARAYGAPALPPAAPGATALPSASPALSAPSAPSAPLLATRPAPPVEKPAAAPRPFYESVWFWGAIGAAALAGGAAYLATRDSSPSTIHLEVQVPH